MAYSLEGRLLEVCTCKAVCPCWVGEDPDNGKCHGLMAWHIEKGSIDGVDVSGLTFGAVANIPGNVLKGNWKIVAYVDDKASKQQEEALVAVWSGKKGGPVADLAFLIGEVAAVERVPITFEVQKGEGRLRIGGVVVADVEPLRGPDGKQTVLVDSVFSTIPGSPAYVGKAPKYKADVPKIGVNVDISGHNSVQGHFSFVS